MRLPLLLALCLLVLPFAETARADIAIIAHPQQAGLSLQERDLINVFMGRYRRLPSGSSALPADLQPLKERFYRRLIGKDQAQVNAYWARLVFSGQASPPLQLGSAGEVVEFVLRNPGALGYLEAADVPDGVPVILLLQERQGP